MPLAYAALETPLGTYYLAATDRGLCRVERAPAPRAFEARLAAGGRGGARWNPQALEPYARALGNYFAGRRPTFPLPFDLRGASPFDRAVWRVVRRIPYGEVRSYAWVAERLGRPGAARAVGGAVGRNPLAVVIPCHRVVRADGGLGGYRGGAAVKAKLLALEGLRAPYGPQRVPRRRPTRRLARTTRVTPAKTRSRWRR